MKKFLLVIIAVFWWLNVTSITTNATFLTPSSENDVIGSKWSGTSVSAPRTTIEVSDSISTIEYQPQISSETTSTEEVSTTPQTAEKPPDYYRYRTVKMKMRKGQVKYLRSRDKYTYVSTDSRIVSVKKSGRLKAKRRGKCYIIIFGPDRVLKRIKITVR